MGGERGLMPDLCMAQMRPDPCQDLITWRSDDTDGKQVAVVYDKDHGDLRLIVYPTVDAYFAQNGGTLLMPRFNALHPALESAKHELGLVAA